MGQKLLDRLRDTLRNTHSVATMQPLMLLYWLWVRVVEHTPRLRVNITREGHDRW